MDFNEIEKLIDSYDTEYYEKRIDQLERRIQNISMDLPEFSGIYNNINDGKRLTKEQKEKRIKSLEKQKKDARDNLKELKSIISTLQLNLVKVEQLAKKEAALRILENCIYDRRFSESEIDLKDMYEKVDRKLFFKSKSKLSRATSKINKEVYKMLKNNKNLRVTEFESIETSINNKGYQMESLMSRAENMYEHQYQFGNEKYKLGIDIERIKSATESMKKEPTQYNTSHCGESVKRLNYINKYMEQNYDSNISYSKLRTLQEKYNEIVLLAREVWYMNEIIVSFSKTDVVNTEMYIGLKDLYSKQIEKISKLSISADKLYDNLGIQNKAEAEKRLNELFQLMKEKELKLENYKNLGYFDQVNFVQNEIYQIRYEMIKILRNNPEFNKKEYDIDIERIIEKENEIYNIESKKVDNSTIKVTKTQQEGWVPTNSSIEETVPKTEEEKIDNSTRVENNTQQQYWTPENKKEVLNISELSENLHIYRIAKYQLYMREKVIGSDLGKISFSQYLEAVAPYLTELIEFEKQREKQSRNIYRNYVRYYASLTDKTQALTFEQYANENYGIDNIDVPIEYEEEYKGMIKK